MSRDKNNTFENSKNRYQSNGVRAGGAGTFTGFSWKVKLLFLLGIICSAGRFITDPLVRAR